MYGTFQFKQVHLIGEKPQGAGGKCELQLPVQASHLSGSKGQQLLCIGGLMLISIPPCESTIPTMRTVSTPATGNKSTHTTSKRNQTLLPDSKMFLPDPKQKNERTTPICVICSSLQSAQWE